MSGVLETLADLVRINSINPAYEHGVPEAAVTAYCDDYLRGAGLSTRTEDVFPGRPNVIGVVRGRQPGRRLVFEAHTDTAGIGGMTIAPFDPVVEGRRLYGRGSCDVKAGLAAMMVAAAGRTRTPPCDIWVVAAADEEFSYRGVLKLCDGLEAAAAVVAEPTEMRVVSASKGCVRWRIATEGVAAHSSRPELGVNAIGLMARVIVALEEANGRLGERLHPLVGPATMNIGLIEGGTQVNIVPDRCVIQIDRRLIPGETVAGVLAEYQRQLDAAGVPARMEPPLLTDQPLETAASEPIVRLASQVAAGLGLRAEPAGVPFGSDASKLAAAGIPSIVFGPGSIDQAHAAVEFVDCDQVEQAVLFYRGLMENFE